MISFIYDTIAKFHVSWVSDYVPISCRSLHAYNRLHVKDQLQDVCNILWNLLGRAGLYKQ